MRRTVGLSFILGILVFGFGWRRPVQAQTSTQNQLTAMLLSADDLPGFEQRSDSNVNVSLPGSQGSVTGVTRAFTSTAAGANVVLSVQLLAFPPDADLSQFTIATFDDTALRSAANVNGLQPANFTLTGPLGVGEADESAEWEWYAPAESTWLVVYADIFQLGPIFGTVAYFSPVTSADPSRVAMYAQLQAGKVTPLIPQATASTPASPTQPASRLPSAPPLQPALLTTADLPAGWQAVPVPSISSSNDDLSCNGQQFPNDSLSETDVIFQQRELKESLFETIQTTAPGVAQRNFATAIGLLDSCPQWSETLSEGFTVPETFTPLKVPAIDDNTAAYAVTFQIAETRFSGELLYLRHGDYIVSVVMVSANGPLDQDEALALATQADNKLVAFLNRTTSQ